MGSSNWLICCSSKFYHPNSAGFCMRMGLSRRAVAPEHRIGVEARHPAFEPGLGRRIARQNLGVVAGHDVVHGSRELLERLVAVDHLAGAVDDGKYPALLDVGIEMGRIRREHDRAAPGFYPDALQPLRVPADPVNGDARFDLGGAVVE